MQRKYIGFFLGIIAFLGILIFADLEPGKPEVTATLAVAALMAMERWNLHKRIALKLLVFIGVSPGRILVGFMATSAFLSMWISNTATTMMMVSILA